MAFMDAEEDGGISDEGKDKGLMERPLKWWPLARPLQLENRTERQERARVRCVKARLKLKPGVPNPDQAGIATGHGFLPTRSNGAGKGMGFEWESQTGMFLTGCVSCDFSAVLS